MQTTPDVPTAYPPPTQLVLSRPTASSSVTCRSAVKPPPHPNRSPRTHPTCSPQRCSSADCRALPTPNPQLAGPCCGRWSGPLLQWVIFLFTVPLLQPTTTSCTYCLLVFCCPPTPTHLQPRHAAPPWAVRRLPCSVQEHLLVVSLVRQPASWRQRGTATDGSSQTSTCSPRCGATYFVEAAGGGQDEQKDCDRQASGTSPRRSRAPCTAAPCRPCTPEPPEPASLHTCSPTPATYPTSCPRCSSRGRGRRTSPRATCPVPSPPSRPATRPGHACPPLIRSLHSPCFACTACYSNPPNTRSGAQGYAAGPGWWHGPVTKPQCHTPLPHLLSPLFQPFRSLHSPRFACTAAPCHPCTPTPTCPCGTPLPSPLPHTNTHTSCPRCSSRSRGRHTRPGWAAGRWRGRCPRGGSASGQQGRSPVQGRPLAPSHGPRPGGTCTPGMLDTRCCGPGKHGNRFGGPRSKVLVTRVGGGGRVRGEQHDVTGRVGAHRCGPTGAGRWWCWLQEAGGRSWHHVTGAWSTAGGRWVVPVWQTALHLVGIPATRRHRGYALGRPCRTARGCCLLLRPSSLSAAAFRDHPMISPS